MSEAMSETVGTVHAILPPAPGPRRYTRSYVLRRSRIGPQRREALQALWPRYGVEIGPRPLDVVGAFGRDAPLVLEVGFGMGETTLAMAAADPARLVLAVDVHTPGAGTLLRMLGDEEVSNVRIAVGDAVEVLQAMLPPATLDEVRVYFPDPWPKARHHKRRLVQAPFVALVADRLRPGGLLHLATDWSDYAEQMLGVVRAEPLLETPEGFSPRPPWRPVTRFEEQGIARGHTIRDLLVRRTG